MTIGVKGLADFSKALRKLDKDAPKGLRLALNEGADLLAGTARPLFPRKSGAAQRTVKAKSTRTSARVSIGSSRVKYVPWLDFGGSVGRGKSVHRPFVKEGRYLFPTLVKIRPQVQDRLAGALLAVAEGAGLAVD